MERQYWANDQYSRRVHVKILGIPTSVRDNELEETLCKIVNKVGVKISNRDIESCHHVGCQGRAIVKFSHRKDCQKLMKVKKDLCKLNLPDIDLDKEKVSNRSLCPYCK